MSTITTNEPTETDQARCSRYGDLLGDWADEYVSEERRRAMAEAIQKVHDLTERVRPEIEEAQRFLREAEQGSHGLYEELLRRGPDDREYANVANAISLGMAGVTELYEALHRLGDLASPDGLD